jgi:hypothetical protein
LDRHYYTWILTCLYKLGLIEDLDIPPEKGGHMTMRFPKSIPVCPPGFKDTAPDNWDKKKSGKCKGYKHATGVPGHADTPKGQVAPAPTSPPETTMGKTTGETVPHSPGNGSPDSSPVDDVPEDACIELAESGFVDDKHPDSCSQDDLNEAVGNGTFTLKTTRPWPKRTGRKGTAIIVLQVMTKTPTKVLRSIDVVGTQSTCRLGGTGDTGHSRGFCP